MTKINPDLFADKSIFDDELLAHLRKGWSVTKLAGLFRAYFREIVGDTYAVVPTFENVSLSILSTDVSIEIEVYPHEGILGGFDPSKIKLYDGATDLLQQAPLPPTPTFTIDDGGGRSYITVFFPTLAQNTTYNLVFEPQTIFNGIDPNAIRTYALETESSFLAPTFGSAVTTPVDSNHNTLSLIEIPVTSFHGARTLTTNDDPATTISGVTVTGGSITVTSVEWNQANFNIEVNITPGSAQPNTSYTVNIPADSLFDGTEGNALANIGFTTPAEVQPTFTGLTTDTGNNQSFNITELRVGITSGAYLNLATGAGTIDVIQDPLGANITASAVAFTTDFGSDRLLLDLTHASFDTITDSNNKLLEDTRYDVVLNVDVLRDGAEQSPSTTYTITTDNESIPVLSGLTSDTGTVSYGMTQFEIDVTGGPFLYNVTDPEFTIDFSGVTINGGVTNIQGGDVNNITYQDSAGQITKVIIPLQNITDNTAYTVSIPANSIIDGTQGNALFSDTLTTDTEIAPTYDFSSSTPIDNVTNVDFPTFNQVVIQVASASYTALREVDLNLITISSNLQGSVPTTGRSFSVGLEQITLDFGVSFSELEEISIDLPAGVLADGDTNSVNTSGVYNFTMRARNEVKPVLNIAGATPAPGSTDVDEVATTQILIPITSTHEIPLTSLTINQGQITVTENGSGDVAGTASISGSNLVIPVTLTANNDYEVVLGTGALADGAQQSDPTTANEYEFDTTPVVTLPNVVERRSFVLPAGFSFASGGNFLTAGTRTSQSLDLTTYTGFAFSPPIYFFDGTAGNSLNRRVWVFEVKNNANSFIPSYPGVPADKARAVPAQGDDDPGSELGSVSPDSKFTGYDFSNNRVTFDSNPQPTSGYYLEFVEFDTEVDLTTAQNWSNAQDWSAHITV